MNNDMLMHFSLQINGNDNHNDENDKKHFIMFVTSPSE